MEPSNSQDAVIKPRTKTNLGARRSPAARRLANQKAANTSENTSTQNSSRVQDNAYTGKSRQSPTT